MNRLSKVLILLTFLTSCEKDVEERTLGLKVYGDALEDIGYSVSASSDGFFLGGQFTQVARTNGNYIDVQNSRKKMAIIKTDLNGNVIWKKSMPDDTISAVGMKVLALSDGSVISTGYIVDPVTKQKDIYLVKILPGGESVEKIFNSTGTSVTGYSEDGNQAGIDIIESGDGFMLLGTTDVARLQPEDSTGNIKGNTDIYLLKLNGNLEPVKKPEVIGYPGNDNGVSIKPTLDGGFIIAGTTTRTMPNQLQHNLWILEATSDGCITKSRILGTNDDEYASDLEVVDDGYVIAGIVGAEGTEQQVFITKLPVNIFSQPLINLKYKLVLTSSAASSFSVKAISRYKQNSFVLAGQAGTGASARMLVYIADLYGAQVSGNEFISVASGTQVAYDVISDSSDNIIAVGKNSYENNSLISFYKFRF